MQKTDTNQCVSLKKSQNYIMQIFVKNLKSRNGAKPYKYLIRGINYSLFLMGKEWSYEKGEILSQDSQSRLHG